MDYIGLLSKEEKSILCEIITGKDFKELFKQNEQEFTKIRKGFRAKYIKEKFALSIAKDNIDKPFIAMWVNLKVKYWLQEIEENIAKLEGQGLSHELALANTLLDSFFANNIDLYFKLIEKSLDSDTQFKLCKIMEDIKSEREKNKQEKEGTNFIEEKPYLNDNVKQNETMEYNAKVLKNEYEHKIKRIEQENKKLLSLPVEAQEEDTDLQTFLIDFKNDDMNYISQFDDTNPSIFASVNADEILSLCCVHSDYNDQKWLMRYADLNYSQDYYIFRKSDDHPPYFANRDKIFYKDGPSEDGFCGIWNWSASPNKKDPTKDYILSKYNDEIHPIEIVFIAGVSTLDNLINLLKKGIIYKPHSRRIIFSAYESKGNHIGILCNSTEINVVHDKTSLAEDCTVVPVYKFTDKDTMRLDNGLFFYRKAFIGIPYEVYHLKSPIEIVKDLVLSSISWPTYKKRNFTRTQYKTFKEFLSGIPADDIINKIQMECHCSLPIAKKLLDEFMSGAEKYIDGNSLEDSIIFSAISANDKLQFKTKELIRKEWELENESLLAEANIKLETLYTELKTTTENLNEVKKILDKTKAEESRLSSIIAENKKLAEDVEQEVSKRIEKARENAANFIADMAFVNVQPLQSVNSNISATRTESFESDFIAYSVCPKIKNLHDLEAHQTWIEAINTTMIELGEAGVREQYRSGLAAFLCAAYIEKQPLLLAGPNSIDIARAFSAAVVAHECGMLYCGDGCTPQVVEKIGADGETIVIINDLIGSRWMNRLPEILSQKDIFYIVTHPYPEDIQVEPNSLYGFMLPLFTEFFVNKKATGVYYGGYFSENFKPYKPDENISMDIKSLSTLRLNYLVRNKINSLLATMHKIHSMSTTDDDFLFAVLPIAYASLKMDELIEIVNDPQKGMKISANLRRNLKYLLGGDNE